MVLRMEFVCLTDRRAYFYTYFMVKVAVIDGQGGGIGSLLVKRLRDEFGDAVEILSLGTNAAATSAMMKSRANKGATGENAIVWNAGKVDMILGPMSIVLPNAMLGELTPRMADAVLASGAKKFLLPLNQEGIDIVGVEKEPLPHMIEKIIETVRQEIEKESLHV
jgi:NAD(P)-dependent dehydrogenase (short-subunit alcohol dehydrogenase family)